jgi:hypothetical protein
VKELFGQGARLPLQGYECNPSRAWRVSGPREWSVPMYRTNHRTVFLDERDGGMSAAPSLTAWVLQVRDARRCLLRPHEQADDKGAKSVLEVDAFSVCRGRIHTRTGKAVMYGVCSTRPCLFQLSRIAALQMAQMEDQLLEAQAFAAACEEDRKAAQSEMKAREVVAKKWRSQCETLQLQLAEQSSAALQKEHLRQLTIASRGQKIEQLQEVEVRSAPCASRPRVVSAGQHWCPLHW